MSESKSLPPAPERTDLGEILIRRGWLQRPQLEECLKLQRIVSTARPGEAAPRIGELLVQKGYVTPDLISQALKEQSRKTLLCPRCNILVNVDIRPDVVGYKCARCKSPLVENNASDAHEPCLESSVIVTSTLPVPSEVRAAEEDTTNRFGKYVLMGEIGRGGTSIVYRAWDSFLHQYVALKRVKPVLGTNKAEERRNRIQSLMTEAHNAIRLRHPNIVAVYDIARTEDDFYMSMELLEGATLGQHMRLCRERGGKSPYHEDPRKWLSVLYQAAHAIHYAHTRPVPVLHLDIKPANIFVTLEDRACVLDFGLARQLSALDGQPQAVAGTPSYMAPEQARGDSHKLDPRTDVYGLGAVLYELLSGRAPFMGDLHEVLRKAIEERPVPPSQLDGRRGRQVLGDTTLRLKFIPPELEALCLRCLEKDPSRRPTTALEFAKELASIVKGTAKPIQGIEEAPSLPAPSANAPVPASAPAPAPALPPKRKRGLSPLVFFVLIIILVGYGTWLLRDAGEGQKRKAEAESYLEAFQPEFVEKLDAVRALGSEDDLKALVYQADCIGTFKQALIAIIEERQPVISDLIAGSQSLKDVRLLSANAEGLSFLAAEKYQTRSWRDLGPLAIVAISRAAGLHDVPAHRFGLALYCKSAGALGEARDLLRSLERTDYQTRAQAFLYALEKR